MDKIKKQFIHEVLEAGGTIRPMAKKLKMPFSTLHLWIKKDPDLIIAQNKKQMVIENIYSRYDF